MTFQQAKEKVRELAKGSAYSISYNELHHVSGDIAVRCCVMVIPRIGSGAISSDDSHRWEEAINSLERKLGITPSHYPCQEPDAVQPQETEEF